MNESTLWKYLKPEFKKFGKFQKVSDRFTPGIPDVLGSHRGVGFALELKEFDGVRVLNVKFRPGQLDWLRDWRLLGHCPSWIIASLGRTVYVIQPHWGPELERGVSPERLLQVASLVFTKTPRTKWETFVIDLLKESV